MPIVLTDTWLARRQQIFPAEAVAIPIAMGMLARYICGRDVIAFCDNQAAVAALIRGAAKCADASGIAETFSALQLQLSVRVWIDWVDSMSNPSDGLSRLGVRDPWTQAQGWKLAEAVGDKFPRPSSCPFQTALDLVHWGVSAV